MFVGIVITHIMTHVIIHSAKSHRDSSDRIDAYRNLNSIMYCSRTQIITDGRPLANNDKIHFIRDLFAAELDGVFSSECS